jgi:hypothetical protein
MDLKQTLRLVRSCSIGCRFGDRVMLLATTLEWALRITPEYRGARRPKYPTWFHNSAVTLVQMLHEDHLDKPVFANKATGNTTWILETAIVWLKTFGLCESLRPKTLSEWYREYKNKGGPAFSTGPV